MIGSLGIPELLFVLVLALLIFGPRKLPEIGKTLGRALGEFRRATSDLKRTLDVELSAEKQQVPPAPMATPRVAPTNSADAGSESTTEETAQAESGVAAAAPEAEPKAEEEKEQAPDPS